MQIFNLESVRNKRNGGFSGGMKQRLLLAQALLNDPQLLILDEPMAGVDPQERIYIRNYISQIATNRIVLLATHTVSDIEAIAKEILILKSGNVIEIDTPGMKRFVKCLFELLTEIFHSVLWERSGARGRNATAKIQTVKGLRVEIAIRNLTWYNFLKYKPINWDLSR